MKFIQFGLLLWLPQRVWTAICYTPAGDDRNLVHNLTSVPAYAPCNNNEGVHSMCCAIGPGRSSNTLDTCLSTGFCRSNLLPQQLWRESCTDPTWQDPACIKLFLNETGYQGGPIGFDTDGIRLTDVLVTDCGDGRYCYGGTNVICCQSGQGFFLDAQGRQTDQNPNTTMVTSSPTPTDPSLPQGHGNGLSSSAKIAIGVGVGIGVPAMVLWAVFMILFHKRYSQHSAVVNTELPGSYPKDNKFHEIGPARRTIYEIQSSSFHGGRFGTQDPHTVSRAEME